MLAVRVDVHGGPEVLRTVQVPAPTPGPGQVLLRHEAIGVKGPDCIVGRGLAAAA
jgi:NADPH:quinone reductase